jgi:hypothetical protein
MDNKRLGSLHAAAAWPALAASKTHGQPGELTRLSEEPDEGGKQHHEYASPAKIEAMGTALYITLRKKKKKPPPEVRCNSPLLINNVVCTHSISIMSRYVPPRAFQRRLVTMFALNQPSLRDKFDENGKSREDPWWAAPDDPTMDAAWLS